MTGVKSGHGDGNGHEDGHGQEGGRGRKGQWKPDRCSTNASHDVEGALPRDSTVLIAGSGADSLSVFDKQKDDMARRRLQQNGDLYKQGGWWKLRWRED